MIPWATSSDLEVHHDGQIANVHADISAGLVSADAPGISSSESQAHDMVGGAACHQVCNRAVNYQAHGSRPSEVAGCNGTAKSRSSAENEDLETLLVLNLVAKLLDLFSASMSYTRGTNVLDLQKTLAQSAGLTAMDGVSSDWINDWVAEWLCSWFPTCSHWT